MSEMTELKTFLNDYWQLLLPIFILQLVLLLTALVDCIRREKTNGPKWVWVLIIICINILGPVAYFIVGRSRD